MLMGRSVSLQSHLHAGLELAESNLLVSVAVVRGERGNGVYLLRGQFDVRG